MNDYHLYEEQGIVSQFQARLKSGQRDQVIYKRTPYERLTFTGK